MVGNMVGSSLAMAPAFVLGQLCDVVDLDGPIFLQQDRVPAMTYTDGNAWSGDEVWGPRNRKRREHRPRHVIRAAARADMASIQSAS